VVVMAGPLLALVAVFGRVERGSRRRILPAIRIGSRSRPDPVVTAAMVGATVLSAVAFALIAVGGLSTGRGWFGVPVLPVALLGAAVVLTSVAAPTEPPAVGAPS
jgi:hypothetical protein